MMTKDKAIERIREMIAIAGPTIEKEAARLLNSGGVSVEDYDDNYVLPRLILAVALENIAAQYDQGKNVPAAIKRDRANLRCF